MSQKCHAGSNDQPTAVHGRGRAGRGRSGSSLLPVAITIGVPAASDLTLAAGETEIDLDGATLRTWAYGNQVPAQEIRLRKGERLRAALTNAMPQDVTVHWDGIAIVNDMDGVPILTQPAVPNGQTFTYDFVVPYAGTYWFHSHGRGNGGFHVCSRRKGDRAGYLSSARDMTTR